MAVQGVVTIALLLHQIIDTTAQQTSFQRIDEDITSISEVDIPETVITVTLTANKIANLYNDDFQNLADCISLFLGLNKIHTIEDEAFRGLNNLQYLYLHFNELTQLPNLKDLPKLTELIIHSNKFSLGLPQSVPVLPNNQIEVLDMSHMEISSVPKEFLQSFPKLIDLNICCNEIHQTPHFNVVSDHLQFVDFSSNIIRDLEPSYFKTTKPSVLRTFKYGPKDSVQNVFVSPHLFRELPNLEEVTIESWGLTTLPDLSGNIGTLEKLTIIGNPQLEELDPKTLFGDPPDYSQFIAMKELAFTGNGLKHISGDILSAMTNLRNLSLVDNKLQTFPMEQLQNLSNLQSVFLESNELTTSCDIGHRDKQGLKIEISGNPLVCNTRLCWLFDSGYIYYDDRRIGKHVSQYPCEQPSNMASVKWPDFSGDDIGCGGSSKPYGCTTPDPVTPGSNNGNTGLQTLKSEDDSGVPVIPIAAGVVGALTLILCIVIGVIIYRQKYGKRIEENSEIPQAPSQKPPPTANATFSDPSEIYITPGQKGTRVQSTSEKNEEQIYTEIQEPKDNQMMRELGDINEIGLQASFYSNINASQ